MIRSGLGFTAFYSQRHWKRVCNSETTKNVSMTYFLGIRLFSLLGRSRLDEAPNRRLLCSSLVSERENQLPEYIRNIKYCSRCGSKAEWKIPTGDNRVRAVCSRCHTVFYVNPKVVVGAVCVLEDKASVILCKRGIPPSYGKWTIPAGFMEMEESSFQGARRETLEETGLKIQKGQLLGVYNLVSAGQVHLIFRSELSELEEFAPNNETLEVELFPWEKIPWDNLAFATTKWALTYARDTRFEEIVVPQVITKN
ncbi:pyrophosphatase, MutT/nudix family protein [Galdieria sulphuraria]|uniref:Pyrophosphatase, MutT/nudix family protein n=1 Tax=Galdieria sulphuraria TaxID=130081 RepID=M2X0N0_GALSU|nr:pyrophosphatase, MutT/nudix family protein [Galdieria sulphuraria]EME29900.1 pyrophosphatase, MutT/nudix family protein [Galdieria sulphuraria]|eukprot:XP_005706420.1 pyrophosphatase, MutT/nudix family protein [Galdieria sulphuraria]